MTVYDSLYGSVKSVIEEVAPSSDRKVLPFFLHLLSVPYCALSISRHLGYRYKLLKTRRLPVPVISVGNLTLGGSGKTPVVSLIASLLLEHGIRPAIVSRGYGGAASGGVNIVSDGKSTLMKAELSGDEPYMLAEKLPGVSVVIGKNRFHAGMCAVNDLGAEAVILDDGYQHMQLFRDLNILVIDGKNYFGNGYLFPRGPLREPEFLKKRADLFLLTKCDRETPRPAELIGEKPLFRVSVTPEELVFFDTQRVLPVKYISGRRVWAFCGIGDPESFFKLLFGVGAVLAGRTVFKDHHRYSAKDMRAVFDGAKRAGAEFVLTTEKDSVRLSFLKKTHIPVIILKIKPDIVEESGAFERAVLACLSFKL